MCLRSTVLIQKGQNYTHTCVHISNYLTYMYNISISGLAYDKIFTQYTKKQLNKLK